MKLSQCQPPLPPYVLRLYSKLARPSKLLALPANMNLPGVELTDGDKRSSFSGFEIDYGRKKFRAGTGPLLTFIFTAVINTAKFATVSHFHPSLILEGKVRAYLSGAPCVVKLVSLKY